jgi:hypothetical protein
MTNLATKPQSIREFLADSPIGSNIMLSLCEKHGASLDMPWPPQFPKEESASQADSRKELARVIQLPLWPEATRGTPNSFLRGALFAAIQGKERKGNILKGNYWLPAMASKYASRVCNLTSQTLTYGNKPPSLPVPIPWGMFAISVFTGF